MISVTKLFEFEAAHKLPFYEGACHNLHGHSYKLEVTVTGKIVPDSLNSDCGMIIDFSKLKEIVEENIIKKYDHKNLNDFFSNPTSEIMVTHFAHILLKELPENVTLVEVKLWETSTSYAKWTDNSFVN